MWEVAVHLAVAGDVFDGVWDLIESVSEGFHTYSFISNTRNHEKGDK